MDEGKINGEVRVNTGLVESSMVFVGSHVKYVVWMCLQSRFLDLKLNTTFSKKEATEIRHASLIL